MGGLTSGHAWRHEFFARRKLPRLPPLRPILEHVFDSMDSLNRISSAPGFAPQLADGPMPELQQETPLLQDSAAAPVQQRGPASILAAMRQGFARATSCMRRSGNATVQRRPAVQPRIFPWNNLTPQARRRLPSPELFARMGVLAYTPPFVLARQGFMIIAAANHPLGRDYPVLLPSISHNFNVPDAVLERHMVLEKRDAVNHNTVLLVEAMSRSMEQSPGLGRYKPQLLLGWVLSAADDLDRDNRLMYLKDAIACAMDRCSAQTLEQAHAFFKNWNIQPFSRFVSLTADEVIDFVRDLCTALNERVCAPSSGQASASSDTSRADGEGSSRPGTGE
jgi:hypothetical protein